MPIEVKTRMKMVNGGRESEVIMDLLLLPRGSGNRNQARAIGRAFKRNRHLKGHVKRVVVGSSRVTVHLRSSISLLREIQKMAEEERALDVPGQLPLFA